MARLSLRPSSKAQGGYLSRGNWSLGQLPRLSQLWPWPCCTRGPAPGGFLGPEEGGRSRPHQTQSPVDLKHWLRLIAFPVSALGMKAASAAPSASGQA